jgi:hypothetical protein
MSFLIQKITDNNDFIITSNFDKEFQRICSAIDSKSFISEKNKLQLKEGSGSYQFKVYSFKLKLLSLTTLVNTSNTHLFYVDNIPHQMDDFISLAKLGEKTIVIKIKKDNTYHHNNSSNNYYKYSRNHSPPRRGYSRTSYSPQKSYHRQLQTHHKHSWKNNNSGSIMGLCKGGLDYLASYI